MKVIRGGQANLALLLLILSVSSCGSPSKFNGGVVDAKASADVKEEPAPEPEPTVVSQPVPVPEVVRPSPAPEPIPPPIDDGGLFKLCESSADNKIVADLYVLPVNTSSLPDFNNLGIEKTICLNQLDIAERAFDEGFPGVQDLIEWFGLDIKFTVDVPVNGNYTFALTADDGARLFVDNDELIDNDGLHSPITKTESLFLKRGQHEINIRYFQGPRTQIALELKWQTPGSNELTYIPLDLVSRPE